MRQCTVEPLVAGNWAQGWRITAGAATLRQREALPAALTVAGAANACSSVQRPHRRRHCDRQRDLGHHVFQRDAPLRRHRADRRGSFKSGGLLMHRLTRSAAPAASR